MEIDFKLMENINLKPSASRWWESHGSLVPGAWSRAVLYVKRAPINSSETHIRQPLGARQPPRSLPVASDSNLKS